MPLNECDRVWPSGCDNPDCGTCAAESAREALRDSAVYTLEPGRCIHRNGAPFIEIRRTSEVHVAPDEVGDIARHIVFLLNSYARKVAP